MKDKMKMGVSAKARRRWTPRGTKMVEEIKTATANGRYSPGPRSSRGFPLHFAGNYYVGLRGGRVMKQVPRSPRHPPTIIKLPLMRKVEYLISYFEIRSWTRPGSSSTTSSRL